MCIYGEPEKDTNAVHRFINMNET